MRTLALLSIAPVKGLRLVHPGSVELGPSGIPGDRRFLLVGEDGAQVGVTERPELMQVVPDYDVATEHLRLTFPDGSIVEGAADRIDARVPVDVWKRRATGRLVVGPFDQALSAFVGRSVRVLRVADAAGQDAEPLTLVSSASVADIGARGDDERLDARRFRMNLEIGGAGPYEEDSWSGALVRVGAATIRVGAQVPRCVVTTLDPDTGEKDFKTLNLIARHRPRIGPRAGLPFGMYAEVLEPGRVSVGDPVEPVSEARTGTESAAGR
jgi:uncharacterized protein YcbX